MLRTDYAVTLLACVSFFVFFQGNEAFPAAQEVRIRDLGAGYNNPVMGGKTKADYYLGIGDKVRINVWKNPDLTGEVTINPDGKVSFPLIGTVEAANLSIEQLQLKLKEKLSTYIRYPDVTITVLQISGRKIVVLGEVNYPGVYTYEGNISIIDAIALSGGMTLDAKRESIIVVSDNFTDHPLSRRVNLFKALRQGAAGPELILKPGDTIYVPRTFVADVTRFAGQVNTMIQGTDSVTAGLFDWRRELRNIYQRNVAKGKTITQDVGYTTK